MTTIRDQDGVAPSDPGSADSPNGEARAARQKARSATRNAAPAQLARTTNKHQAASKARTAAKQAEIRKRKFRAVKALAEEPLVPAIAEGTLLSAAQMREARKLIREKQLTLKKEREFGRRLVATLTEGQNALNIAFGAILSAYIGTVLAAIDDKPFDQWTLAGFFVLIGVFIGGLCIGNLVVLRKHFGLGLGFLATGAVAAYLSLGAARRLGFELPILKVMFVCWYAMLVATDGLLTAIIFFHHRSVTHRAAKVERVRTASSAA